MRLRRLKEETTMGYQKLAVVFDGPPGPETGRFVEIEREDGSSVKAGRWEERTEDGLWVLHLRVIDEDIAHPNPKHEKRDAMNRLEYVDTELADGCDPIVYARNFAAEADRLQAEVEAWTRRAAFNRSVALCDETWTQEAEDRAANQGA